LPRTRRCGSTSRPPSPARAPRRPRTASGACASRTSAAGDLTTQLRVPVLPTSAPRDSTPRRARSIPSWMRAHYLLGDGPIPRNAGLSGSGLLTIEEIERQREDVDHPHLLAREAGLRADRHRALI